MFQKLIVNTKIENTSIQEAIENYNNACKEFDDCFNKISAKWSEENKKVFKKIDDHLAEISAKCSEENKKSLEL